MLDTVENVTVAKKSYETFHNIIERNFYSAMEKILLDDYDITKEDFYRENFWAKHVVVFGLRFIFSTEDFQDRKS